jgi:hypothetical protein
VKIKKAFIDLIPLDVKTAEIITAQIKKLERDGLILEDCRDQSYENQEIMPGVHSDVRKRILDLNPLEVFVPWNNHSLILVGVHAAHVNVQALTLWYCGTFVSLLFMFNPPVECSERLLSILQ